MIYLIEDDNSIRELVTYALSAQGMDCVGFALPSEFWRALDERGVPDLLLLDIMLPEEDGLSILKKLRAAPHTKSLPIIMLTAKGTERDKVLGLDLGADDYVPKPFGMMELTSRVRALLRRTGADSAPEKDFTVGSLYVSPKKHIVQVEGKPVTLSLKEFELLRLLLENRGEVLTRPTLLDKIWGYEFDGETRTVDVHIRTLRKKLGSCGNLIETVRGVGYKIA
jgi:two-component system alkaline phosphatase synthesis response regulator PhoP